MATSASDITATDWSPRVGSPGDVVTDLSDIDQCIVIILTTRRGSDPHRPLFGCDAWKWLDTPAGEAIPSITRAVIEALELWEPRIAVDSVKIAFTASGHFGMTITWHPRDAYVMQTTEVPLALAA